MPNNSESDNIAERRLERVGDTLSKIAARVEALEKKAS
jgi:phosphate uptake regulator